MNVQRLAHLLENGQAAVERAERILIDHLRPRALRPPGVRGDRGQRRAVESRFARIRGLEAEHQTPRGGFAGPGLADEAQRLAPRNLERHVVHGAYIRGAAEQATAGDVDFLQATRLDQRLGHSAACPG